MRYSEYRAVAFSALVLIYLFFSIGLRTVLHSRRVVFSRHRSKGSGMAGAAGPPTQDLRPVTATEYLYEGARATKFLEQANHHWSKNV